MPVGKMRFKLDTEDLRILYMIVNDTICDRSQESWADKDEFLHAVHLRNRLESLAEREKLIPVQSHSLSD